MQGGDSSACHRPAEGGQANSPHRGRGPSQVAKARRDADEAEKAFEALSMRSRKDDEEATRVRKEQDELLQKDVETRQRILDLLGEIEKERDMKLGAEEKLATLEMRVSLDAATVARLRKEWDELI